MPRVLQLFAEMYCSYRHFAPAIKDKPRQALEVSGAEGLCTAVHSGVTNLKGLWIQVHIMAVKKYQLMDRQLVEQARDEGKWPPVKESESAGEANRSRMASACWLGCEAWKRWPTHQGGS